MVRPYWLTCLLARLQEWWLTRWLVCGLVYLQSRFIMGIVQRNWSALLTPLLTVARAGLEQINEYAERLRDSRDGPSLVVLYAQKDTFVEEAKSLEFIQKLGLQSNVVHTGPSDRDSDTEINSLIDQVLLDAGSGGGGKSAIVFPQDGHFLIKTQSTLIASLTRALATNSNNSCHLLHCMGNKSSGEMGKFAEEFVNEKLGSKKVVVFSKTYCPYCDQAKKTLEKYNLSGDVYEVIELDEMSECEEIQDFLKKITGARSVPRVFIGGKFVGGGDETKALDRKGGLESALKKAGAL